MFFYCNKHKWKFYPFEIKVETVKCSNCASNHPIRALWRGAGGRSLQGSLSSLVLQPQDGELWNVHLRRLQRKQEQLHQQRELLCYLYRWVTHLSVPVQVTYTPVCACSELITKGFDSLFLQWVSCHLLRNPHLTTFRQRSKVGN